MAARALGRLLRQHLARRAIGVALDDCTALHPIDGFAIQVVVADNDRSGLVYLHFFNASGHNDNIIFIPRPLGLIGCFSILVHHIDCLYRGATKYTSVCAGRCGGEHIDGGQTATPFEAGSSYTRDGVGKGDGGQTAAFIEAATSQTRDDVGKGDGGQTAARTENALSHTRNYVALFCSFVIYYLALI